MALEAIDFRGLRPDPFVGWLHRHGLIHRGCAWSCETDPVTGEQTFRRDGSTGKEWPADRIPGPLIVRPKRQALGALIP